MGNLIKINIYAEMKREKNNQIKLETLEEIILKYNSWLKNTKRDDKIETYKKFLLAR